MFRKPLLGLLGEQQLAVGLHFEYATRRRDERESFHVVLPDLQNRSRQTDGLVCVPSDGAVSDFYVHGAILPLSRRGDTHPVPG